MKIVINEDELEHHVVNLLSQKLEGKILLDQFLEGAIEAEADAICDGENIQIIGIMQHIEPAGFILGIHMQFSPPLQFGDFVIRQIEEYTTKIAVALKTVGLINIQFAIKDDKVYIIEANPRASRTVPFICKAYQQPYVNFATKVMLREKKVADFDFKTSKSRLCNKRACFLIS